MSAYGVSTCGGKSVDSKWKSTDIITSLGFEDFVDLTKLSKCSNWSIQVLKSKLGIKLKSVFIVSTHNQGYKKPRWS